VAQRPIIDPEIAALLPALTHEEFAELETKVSAEEFREPLIVWKETGILLDGHHRLKLCDKHNITYSIKELSFPSREQAIQWVIDNQLGRRNLTDERRAYFRGKEYLNKKQQEVGRPATVGQNDPPGERVSETLAKKHDVSEKTIRRDAEFAQAVDKIGEADPAKREAILSGTSGQTRQQVTSANKPLVLCDRCKRVGAVPDCKACEEVHKAAKSSRKRSSPKRSGKRPRSGAETFDWRRFHSDLEALLRQVDVLVNVCGIKETTEAEVLRADLDTWSDKFKAVYQKATRQEPPSVVGTATSRTS
jgi:hypothetical protein